MITKWINTLKGWQTAKNKEGQAIPADLELTLLSGKKVQWSELEGRVKLIVNTASLCGFTPQLKDLQKLSADYGPKGLAVIGFPSNDFGKQEPGDSEEIGKFCEAQFQVRFPLLQKDHVRGRNKQEVYKYLTVKSGSALSGEVLWNFEKFLIDKNNLPVARARSWVKPYDKRLINKIEELLAQT
ncbi:MAG: glutathione peroxidase [Bdellovibrionales bacterium CG10_big_fil_rev_8_21_14_0_10_45_34]|nr:MAG: glutathione peroxidase [Bdellovibrionales bacterium CG10_big_fil_rev_8_21_14_0_10_45_34]